MVQAEGRHPPRKDRLLDEWQATVSRVSMKTTRIFSLIGAFCSRRVRRQGPQGQDHQGHGPNAEAAGGGEVHRPRSGRIEDQVDRRGVVGRPVLPMTSRL